jgi:hypothetical protein
VGRRRSDVERARWTVCSALPSLLLSHPISLLATLSATTATYIHLPFSIVFLAAAMKFSQLVGVLALGLTAVNAEECKDHFNHEEVSTELPACCCSLSLPFSQIVAGVFFACCFTALHAKRSELLCWVVLGVGPCGCPCFSCLHLFCGDVAADGSNQHSPSIPFTSGTGLAPFVLGE